jgi:PAS domain S-box-containing protein
VKTTSPYLSISHGEILVKNKEQFYRTLIDTTYDWEELLGPDNQYAYVSPACKRITGYSPEEFMADPLLLESIVHPEDRGILREHLQEGFHSLKDETHCLDFRIITREGETKWIDHCCRPLFNGQGVFIGRRGSNRDISERKRAETEVTSLAERYQLLSEEFEVTNQELKTQNDELTIYAEKLEFQEKKLNDILSSMEDFVYIVDRDGGCKYVNTAVADAVTSEPPDLVGISIGDVWDRAGAVMESIESFRTDLAAAFHTGTPKTGENVFRYPSGLRWRHYTIHPLRDEKGDVSSALVTSRDITGMKEAERELKKSHRQLMDIIEFLPDATLVLNNRQHVIAWNRAMENMTSVPKQNILGKGNYEYSRPFYGEPRPMLCDFIIEAKRNVGHLYDLFDSGEDMMIAETYAPKFNKGNGAHFWAKASVIRDDEGRVIGAIETIRDISERKRAEEETMRRNTELSVMNAKLSTLYEELAETEEELRQNYDEIVKGERALRETTQYLENLIGYANAPIIVWDPEYRITRFNHAFERLTGRTVHTVIGRPLDLLLPESQREELMDLIRRTASGERFESVEIPILGADGELRTVLWNSATLYQADGNTVQSVIAQGQDITDRKRAEEELARKNEELVTLNEDLAEKDEELRQNLDELGKSERTLREASQYVENLIGYANAPIIVWDPEYRITRFNQAFEYLTGKAASQVIGQPLDILFPEQYAHVSMDLIRRTSSGERFESVEIPILGADGEIRTVLWNSATLYQADGNTVQSVIAQGQDITGRKRAEEELARKNEELVALNEDLAEKEEELRQNLEELGKSERALREVSQYLENLIGYANAPIIVWDPEYRITRFNQAFEILIGRKADEVIGKPLDILFPGKCREVNMDLIRKTSTGERWETVEIPVLTAGGEIRTVLWNSATLYEADGTTVRSVIAQGQDITERKEMDAELRRKADELARSNEELERFAYVASHDLREPLRMVTSFSQLLQQRYQGRLDADADEFIHYVVEGGKRMDALVNDLLEFSRINSRAKPLQPTDMNEVVEDASRSLSVALEESGARIEIEYLPRVPADRTQMSQVFQNLLSNAIKFRGKNIPLIRIWAERKENNWVFSVQDNGIGIDPSYSETIFEIFKRLHTKEEYPGTGIGLAISRRIIERHGGRIWVTSQVGEGSTFSFTLPAENVAACSTDQIFTDSIYRESPEDPVE